jgi:hypothetical protein
VYRRCAAVEAEVATAEVSSPAAVPSIDVKATEVAVTAVNVVPIDEVTAEERVPEPVAVTVTDSLAAAELSTRKKKLPPDQPVEVLVTTNVDAVVFGAASGVAAKVTEESPVERVIVSVEPSNVLPVASVGVNLKI